MKLRVLDQISVSSVQPETLRPGQIISVHASKAKELLKAHPRAFAQEGADEDEAPAAKAEAPPLNKAEPAAPANKARPKRKGE
jgi:hypothetical protein